VGSAPSCFTTRFFKRNAQNQAGPLPTMRAMADGLDPSIWPQPITHHILHSLHPALLGSRRDEAMHAQSSVPMQAAQMVPCTCRAGTWHAQVRVHGRNKSHALATSSVQCKPPNAGTAPARGVRAPLRGRPATPSPLATLSCCWRAADNRTPATCCAAAGQRVLGPAAR
jgi:hypothetical protein